MVVGECVHALPWRKIKKKKKRNNDIIYKFWEFYIFKCLTPYILHCVWSPVRYWLMIIVVGIYNFSWVQHNFQCFRELSFIQLFSESFPGSVVGSFPGFGEDQKIIYSSRIKPGSPWYKLSISYCIVFLSPNSSEFLKFFILKHMNTMIIFPHYPLPLWLF